jgi:hypothetical protein
MLQTMAAARGSGRHPCGDGGQRGVHRAGVLRADGVGLRAGGGDQPAYQVLESGKPYEDLGAGFHARRESPEQRRAYLLQQLEKLSPGCTITISPAEAA